MDKGDDKIRLNKHLAAGLGVSRREADELIAAGKITINGKPAILGSRIDKNDKVCYNNKVVPFEDHFLYLAFHKPVGYVCSRRAQGSAPTLYDLLPAKYHKLKTVGRLDKDSSGLILLTNDGDFALRLTHPSHEIYKRYYVECAGRFTTAIRRQLLDGMYDNGEFLRALNVEQLSVQYGSCKLIFTLGEGRKREVRRLCKDVGLQVRLLRRIAIGQLELDEKLAVGSWRIMSLNDCELALKPLAVPNHPRPTEPPKPYWVKDKPERKQARNTRRDGGRQDERRRDGGRHRDEEAPYGGPAARGAKEDYRRPRRPSSSPEHAASARPPRPWYEEEKEAPGPEEPRSPRPQRGPRGSYRKEGDYSAPSSGGHGRSSSGASRGVKKKPASLPPEGGGRNFRLNKPPRSWR